MSVLKLQSSSPQRKQICRVTTPCSMAGCSPFIQPGAWVPQWKSEAGRSGILSPSRRTTTCQPMLPNHRDAIETRDESCPLTRLSLEAVPAWGERGVGFGHCWVVVTFCAVGRSQPLVVDALILEVRAWNYTSSREIMVITSLIGWLTDWQIDWLTHWLTDSLTWGLTDWLTS